MTILDDNGQPVSLGVLGFRMKPHESVTTLTEPGYEIVAPDSEGVYRANAGLTVGDMDLEGNGVISCSAGGKLMSERIRYESSSLM